MATLLLSWLFIIFGEIQLIRKNVASLLLSWKKVFLSLLLLLLAVLVDLLLFLAPHIVSGHASVAEKKSVALFLQFVRSALATWLKPKIRDIWALHILTTFDD